MKKYIILLLILCAFGVPNLFAQTSFNYTSIGSTEANNIEAELNAGNNVTVNSTLDITVTSPISKTTGSNSTLTFNAVRDIFIEANISSNSNALSLVFNANSNNGDIGAITLSSDLSSNGGAITFQDDISFNGTSSQNVNSAAAEITFSGEVMLSNTNGVILTTSNAYILFSGAVNSGNSYSLDPIETTWSQAYSTHNTSSEYLATITSRMELTAAMAVVPSGGAWLGGSDQDEEGVWKWVTGPENGTVFWTTALNTGISGYSGTNGSYVNWNTGEPNNSGGEDALQIRNNTDGKWNDLPTTGTNTLASVVETELSNSPLTINAGEGTVTFAAPVGSGKPLKSLEVTAATTAVNGGGICTGSESSAGGQTYSGDISLGSVNTVLEMMNTSTSFSLPSNKSITNEHSGEATLTIKNPGNISFESGSSVSSISYPLNIVLQANTDADAGGHIALSNVNLTTNNGHLWIGGGSNTTNWNGLTVGDGYATNATSTGVLLDDVAIDTGAGNIYIAGKSTSTVQTSHGLHLKYTNASTIATTSGSITLMGNGGLSTASTAANCDGVRIEGTLQTATGNIELTGYSTTKDQSEGIAVEPTGVLTSNSGNFTLLADNIYFATEARATSAGELAITPVTASATIGIAGAGGSLSLPASRFTSNFTDGFSLITIGSESQSGNIILNTIAFRDNSQIKTSGEVIINSGQTITQNAGVKLTIDNTLRMRTGAAIEK